MFATPGTAELLVHEPFSYAEGSVTGQNGGAGWAAGWTVTGEPCRVTSGFLGYVDAGSLSLNVEGGILDTAGPATTRSFREVAGGPLNDVWISFLYRLPESNRLYEGVNFYLGATSIFAVSNSSITSSAAISLNNFTQGNSSVNAGAGEFGRTYLMVLHVTSPAGGGNDQVELFVDPALSGTPTIATATIEAPSFDFDRIRVAGESGASLQIDELRIGESFADVTPHLTLDADGDGLTDAQELEVGLNPTVSDADLIQAIRDHPEFFGLFDPRTPGSLAGNGVVVDGRSGMADLFVEIQQSTDLSSWLLYDSIHRQFELPEGKNFLRLQVTPSAP